MSGTYEIKGLEEVLKSHLEPYKTIISYEAKAFTSAGENFGSLMLGLNVLVKNAKTDEEETIHSVAKLLPTSDFLRDLFNIQVTFRKEVSVYVDILRELRAFAKEYKFTKALDYLPDYYGSRISLNPNATMVDNGAVLILENLKTSGYVVIDRLVGFDLATAKIILEDLALFHGVPLAYKLNKPELFKKHLMPFLGRGIDSTKNDLYQENYKVQLDAAAALNDRCAELKERLSEIFRSSQPLFDSNCTFDDCYGTICHLDLWVNNILVKYVDGKPVKSKFVDYQVLCYANLARDIVFFLFTSLQFPILEQYYDELVQTYHKALFQVLKSFGCNVEAYSLERLHTEMARVAKASEMVHSVEWLMPILAERGAFQDMSNVGGNDILQPNTTDKYNKRLVATLLFFDKKGWL